MQREHAMKLPVPHFHATLKSEELEQHFRQSFLLEDTMEWGPDWVLKALHHHRGQNSWLVWIFDDTQYIIEAPNPQWLDVVLEAGTLRLDDTEFTVVGTPVILKDSNSSLFR